MRRKSAERVRARAWARVGLADARDVFEQEMAAGEQA
jgi:hypothetical protein